MVDYAVRLTRSYTDTRQVIEKFCEVSEKVLVYQHDSDTSVSRTHIHCYLCKVSVGTDTLKNYVKKVLGVVTPDEWSFKTTYNKKRNKVDDGFVTYMSKGKLDPVYNKGFDPIDIMRLTQAWVEPSANTGSWNVSNGKLEVQGNEEQPKKVSVYDMQMECANRIDRNDIDGEDAILDVIADVMRKHRHRTHMYDTINWYDNVRFMSHRHRDGFRSDVLDKIRSRR